MGTVIPISAATASPDLFFNSVDTAFEGLRQKAGLRARPQQQQLAHAVAEAFEARELLIAEAPTGTGKTIGYLVGALAVQQKTQLPVVVATATVALQEQLINGDVPRLVSAGLIERQDVVAAKGRGRYFCVSAAEKLNETSVSQLDIFDEGVNARAEELTGLDDMLSQFWGEGWDGDIDRWKAKQPVFWAKVQANSDTCTKTKCDYFDKCAFFRARNALFHARVIVANHDLVLSDLSQAAEDNEPVFPIARYNLVVDEAHHLPDKAMEHGRSAVDIERIERTLVALPGWVESVMKQPVAARALAKTVSMHVLENTGHVQASCTRLRAALKKLTADGGHEIVQFEDGVLDSAVRDAAENLVGHLESIEEQFYEAMRQLKNDKLAEKLGAAAASALLPVQVSGSALYSTVRDAAKGLSRFLSPGLPVKWLEFSREQPILVASPLDGNEVLDELLWKSRRAVPVMVSATIRDFKGFERFAARIGAPEQRRELVVDPVLPYHNARLEVPFMRFTPRQAERAGFERELCEKLPAAIDPKAGGALVLAPSWKLMERLKGTLREKFGAALLAQGSLPTKQLIEEHKKRIDAGKPSILLGVASLSEGLDLPGKYCVHVLICAIPFSSPVDPVEKERARVAGSEYFIKHSLPDALVKLVQMTGRLIRREDDHGRISVFDMRLRSARFGRQMLEALPGYRTAMLAPSATDAAWLEAQKKTRAA